MVQNTKNLGVRMAIKAATSASPITSRGTQAGECTNCSNGLSVWWDATQLTHFPHGFASCSLADRLFFLRYQLFTFEVSVMAGLQKSTSFSLMGILAASCLILTALWAQKAAALPVTSHCKIDDSDFQRPYFINRTFMLAEEVKGISLSLHSYLELKEPSPFSLEHCELFSHTLSP